MMDDKVWTINMKERKGIMKIDNRTWIILAVMVLGAVYIGWLHMVIHDLTKQNKALRGDSIYIDVDSLGDVSAVNLWIKRELWPPVDARTDRKHPMTIMERND